MWPRKARSSRGSTSSFRPARRCWRKPTPLRNRSCDCSSNRLVAAGGQPGRPTRVVRALPRQKSDRGRSQPKNHRPTEEGARPPKKCAKFKRRIQAKGETTIAIRNENVEHQSLSGAPGQAGKKRHLAAPDGVSCLAQSVFSLLPERQGVALRQHHLNWDWNREKLLLSINDLHQFLCF